MTWRYVQAAQVEYLFDNDVVITNNLEVAGDLPVNSILEQQEKLSPHLQLTEY